MVWLVALLVLPIYTYYSRGISGFRYPLISAAFLFIIQVIQLRRTLVFRPRGESVARYIGAAVVSLLVSLAVYSMGVAALDGFAKLPITPGFWTLAIVGAATLIVGISAFIVRSWNRTLWGLTEVAAGVGLPVYRASETSLETFNAEFAIFALTAGVYLIVRGLDNMSQGRKDAAAKAKAKELERNRPL